MLHAANTGTIAYWSLLMTLTSLSWDLILHWDWCREIVGVIREAKIYFYPWHANLCSTCISCPDRMCFFSGTGKKSALCHLMQRPLTLSSEDIQVIESFVVLWPALWQKSTKHASRYLLSHLEHLNTCHRPHKESDLSSWICVGTISCGQTNFAKLQVLGVGCLSGLPSLQQQKHLKSWSVVGAQKAVQAFTFELIKYT